MINQLLIQLEKYVGKKSENIYNQLTLIKDDLETELMNMKDEDASNEDLYDTFSFYMNKVKNEIKNHMII